MAYRPLVENDRVKIMQKGHVAFGKFGTVLDTDSLYAFVKTGDISLWFLQKDLMVAHDADHGFYTSSEYYSDIGNYKYPDHFVDSSDDEDDNQYDGWDIDDFIARIKHLERQLEEIENKACNN